MEKRKILESLEECIFLKKKCIKQADMGSEVHFD